MLKDKSILNTGDLDDNDETLAKWNDGSISFNALLDYAITKDIVNISALNLESDYLDTNEIYQALIEYVAQELPLYEGFEKKAIYYMLESDYISGTDICLLLYSQHVLEEDDDYQGLLSGSLSAKNFMYNKIYNLEITPDMLALPPCSGSFVLTDINTGKVKALVSYPGYDANQINNVSYYASLINNSSSPLYNRATQQTLAPGSTFKPISAIAGLEEGVIDADTYITDYVEYTKVVPHANCWNSAGHGTINVEQAIEYSCNYFFYNVGYQLATRTGSYNEEAGLDTLGKYADLYGLTDKSGVEIGEYAPDISTKDPVRSAIGQGSNSYTTVGLARYVTTIANSGTCYNLTLLDKTTDSQGNLLKEYHAGVRNQIDLPQEYWDAFHLGMRQVVENKKYFSDLVVNAAGKTGTAEQTASRPNHALFICYAPYENPEIAIATRIPFGYSSDYAAQFTRDIIKYYYGLAEEDDLITGTADTLDNAVSNEM